MTTISKLTEEEYQAICELHAAMHKVSHLDLNTFFEDKEDITLSEMDSLVYDIGNDPLIQCINRYKAAETTVVAVDTEYAGFSIVETLYGPVNDCLFGFRKEKDVVVYYLCHTYPVWNEVLQDTEEFFEVDEQVINLNACLRIPFTTVKPSATTYELLESLNTAIDSYNDLQPDADERLGWWDVLDNINYSDKVTLRDAIKEIEVKIMVLLESKK